MTDKPTTPAGYDPESVRLAKATCLYIATKLGDLLDEIVIVGGLVPSLLIPQEEASDDRPIHVGTMDVDLGLAIAVLEEARYREICERLRSAGFEPDINEEGNTTSQRWKIEVESKTTDRFLTSPSVSSQRSRFNSWAVFLALSRRWRKAKTPRSLVRDVNDYLLFGLVRLCQSRQTRNYLLA